MLKGMPMKTPKPLTGIKTIRWNTQKKGGWDTYRNKTENNVKLWKSSEIKNEQPEKLLKCIEKELTKAKFASFCKVKLSSKTKEQKEMDELQNEKLKTAEEKPANKTVLIEAIDGKMSAVLKNIEKNKFEKEVTELKRMKHSKGKAAAVFALKDKVLGNKKTPREQVVVIDPDTGLEVYSPQEIKTSLTEILCQPPKN